VTTDDDIVDEVARRLYGVPPSRFVAGRDREAKALRDAGQSSPASRVKALRRPSVAAGLVNAVARERSDLVDELRSVGRSLRGAATAADSAARLRALDDERRSTVRSCVEAAVEVADAWGTSATAATLREVEQTFWAAAVDVGALAAVRSATLVRTLAPNGFGSVDIEDASAVPVVVEDEPAPPPVRALETPGAPSPPGPADKARQEAAAGLQRAEQTLRAAEEEAGRAAELADSSDRRVSELKHELAELRRRLTSVEEELRVASADDRRAAAGLRATERDRRAAATAVERARSRLDALSPDA
jgi:hypothetical protein